MGVGKVEWTWVWAGVGKVDWTGAWAGVGAKEAVKWSTSNFREDLESLRP